MPDAVFRIGNFDADLCGARLHVEFMQDEGDLAFEGLIRESPEQDCRGRANLDRSNVLLSHIGDDPHLREIGNPEEHVSGADLLALDNFLFDHDARDRRRPVDFSRHRVLAGFERGNHARRYIEIFEALNGALEVFLSFAAWLPSGCVPGNLVIDFGLDDIGAVDAEQRIAGFDVLAHLGDVKLLDVAIGSERHFTNGAFVDFGDTRCPHRPRELAHLGRFGLHACALHLVETDLDRRPVVFLVLVDRDVGHIHRVFFRNWRRIRQTHRVAIKLDLVLAFCGHRSRRRFGRFHRLG